VDIVVLLLAATATAVATGFGAIPVWMLGARARVLQPGLLGLAIGVMAFASIVGLLEPAIDEGSAGSVLGGLAAGIAFLLVARRLVGDFQRRRGAAASAADVGVGTAALVFLVLFVHSLPEGLAVGTAYASDTSGLALFVVVAIAIHNVPEGTSVAIPMTAAGVGHARQFWAAVATSAPQPPGALIAYFLVEQVESLLPASFSFAAGAMLALVTIELMPQAFVPGGRTLATAGVLVGAAVMLLLGAVLGV
jgi:ZIP family zinc transporter